MGFPEVCDICMRGNVGKGLFDGEIELDLEPYKGESPSVMLVGQDPTVTKRVIRTALDLKNQDGLLYRYIVGDIQKPAELELRDVYATDLVKCRFPDNQTPRVISEKHGDSMVDVISLFFKNCRKWFREEIQEIQPKIILSLGEPVHQLLRKEFGWDVPEQMKDAFGHRYDVDTPTGRLSYVPCIHMNSKNHQHYKDTWAQFAKTLKRAV